MSETTNISTETRDDDSSSTASTTSNVASSMALTSSPETKIDSPSTNSAKPAMKPSMIETFRTCVLSGIRIDKEELKKKFTMPVYLRRAMRDCIRYQDPTAMSRHMCSNDDEDVVSPETPMVAFINTNSGGRHGPVLKERLKQLMSEEQVFDLSDVKPHEFVEYGLGCLEMFISLGDFRAKEARERMRIIVAGGDGTVGWVLGCLSELHKNGRAPVPPVGIIPLGTGNDLSRSFNWGGSFPFVWKSAINRSLSRASTGPITLLDSWRVSLSMPEGTTAETPYSLKPIEKLSLDEGLELGGERPDEVQCYDGVFYNYYSIGMDAQVAYGFHNLRNEKPYLANGPIANKIIYSGYGCTQGWFLTPCSSDPGLRGIRNILRMHVKKFNSSAWENVPVPSSVRAIVALNLHSYGSGRNPWGNLKPEYMERRGFVEAQADDGLLEIFGLKQGWHASFVMVELISAKHIAQASAIRFEIRGGEWQDAYMQMDGEPWKQPLSKKKSTFVEIKREPFQSYMIRGEQN